MNNASMPAEELRHVLTTPTRGVLGLVDELLAVARERSIHLDWKGDHCRVQFREGSTSDSIDVPLRKSVIRAALARIAVLCNQRKANSVSPYGGQGELLVGSNPATTIRVAFVNTPDEQSLELMPLRDENGTSTPEAACEGAKPKASHASS